MKIHTWLRRSTHALAILAVTTCLGCPEVTSTGGGSGPTTEVPAGDAPPIEAQIEEAGIDTAKLEATAESDAETITSEEDADAALSDLEASLAEEGE